MVVSYPGLVSIIKMRWTTAPQFIRDTLQSWLGDTDSEVSEAALRTEEIRQAMLECLAEYSGCRQYPQVERRLVFARDLQSLWYLRGDLLAMMSLIHGEIMARRRMQTITAMFEGFLPSAMFSRTPTLEH